MEKRIELKERCRECAGTGLYVGLGERDGAAVVCNKCGGTGLFLFIHVYEDFEKRTDRIDVKRVVHVNPGICIGVGKGGEFTLADFGGMPYEDWKDGKPFPPGSENRRFTCPAWWYQSACYEKKPK